MTSLKRRAKLLMANPSVANPSVKEAVILFVVMRIFLSVWAVVAITINPIPETPDEVVRPYLGEPDLREGLGGLLLGPWQRFDTLRYMHIARQGYVNEENSVFPPLYPAMTRLLGYVFGGGSVGNLVAAISIANLACLAMFIMLHRVVSAELDSSTATRTLIYLALFPTGFFLFTPYTEPLFMLFALGSLWAARRGRFWRAGSLGFLASLTRLTGWILVVPLVYEFWRQHAVRGSNSFGEAGEPVCRRQHFRRVVRPDLVAITLPAVALLGFMAWRWWVGLPSLTTIYGRYWYQGTGIPGVDVISAGRTLFFDGVARNNEIIALSLDFGATILLIVTTIIAFKHLGTTYGLYSAMLLIFMLLPTSEVKPLYSFSRYALAFFPTFMLLGVAGRNPLVNRLILYPSLLLYLYFSGQFFAWGWVA